VTSTKRTSVLLRDLNDTHYPFEGEYPDFKTRPAWRECIAFEHSPTGLAVHLHEYLAYVDHRKKEWDYTDATDLLNRDVEDDDERRERFDRRQLVEMFWKSLPRANQARVEIDALLRFVHIAIVDDKGDSLHRFPHIYVDTAARASWFAGACEFELHRALL